MRDFTRDDAYILLSMQRIPIIRALLARCSAAHLSSLTVSERDHALDDMALREYRAEQLIYPAE